MRQGTMRLRKVTTILSTSIDLLCCSYTAGFDENIILLRRYYAAKRKTFEAGTGGTVSINDDFAGKIVKHRSRL